MRSAGRWLYVACVGGLTLALLTINLRLYSAPNDRTTPDRIDPQVLRQLTFIRNALDAGAGYDMQALFPEGFFFAHALYGLAWTEIGTRRDSSAALRSEALAEARWALQQLDTPAGRAPFAEQLDPSYGVFYVGWSTWLRGGVIKLQPPATRDPAQVARFAADSALLAAAFDRSASPFLAAYPGQAWPVDSTVAIAALRLHDTLLPARFTPTIDRWLSMAQMRLDPATGLLPHRADPRTGAPLEGARGSSQSLIARFLVEIDPVWGAAQYALFRQQFVATPMGIPGVREYPHGVAGRGDVDSGPLIFGLSASATAVALGAAYVHNDRSFAAPVERVAETAGLPMAWRGTEQYLFGLVPVADAFLAWSRTAHPWIAAPPSIERAPVVMWWWRWPLHTLSLLIALGLWLPVMWTRRSRRFAAHS